MSNSKRKESGFNRLRSAAVGGAVGLIMGGGAVFAATSPFTVTRSRTRAKGASSVKFTHIGNASGLFGIGDAKINAVNVSGLRQNFSDGNLLTAAPLGRRWHSKLPASYVAGYHTSVTSNAKGFVAPEFSRAGVEKSTKISHTKISKAFGATSFPKSCGVATGKTQTHYPAKSAAAFSVLAKSNPARANCFYHTTKFVAKSNFKHTNKLNTSFTQTFKNAFDEALWMKVDGANFANPDSLVSYDTIASATTAVQTNIVAGINAQVEFYFPPATGIVRALYTLSNTTGSDIATSVEIGGNLGSDKYTSIESSQSGDTTADNTDKWIISSDRGFATSPYVTITRYGDGARVTPTQGAVLGVRDLASSKEDDFSNIYSVTVPANDSVSILVFAEINAFLANAKTNAVAFSNLSVANAAGLLNGLTTEQKQAILNYDKDSDGDGYYDLDDVFPNDATETVDTDGDGVGDNADAFPNNALESVDTDGDGVGDNADAFPSDATETVDSDGDGVGNNADAFPNDSKETIDSDGDGIGDNADIFPNNAKESVDTDGDGVGDSADAFPNNALESVDTDGDGIGNNADAFPNDATESVDSDGDGVGDNADAFPNDTKESVDSDGDGVGDNSDAFPEDSGKTKDTSSSSSGGFGALDISSLLFLFSSGITSFVIRRRRRVK